MSRLAELPARIREQLEAVLEGLRILTGIRQPAELAVAPAPAPARCPFCQQLVMQTATICASCRRKLPATTAR